MRNLLFKCPLGKAPEILLPSKPSCHGRAPQERGFHTLHEESGDGGSHSLHCQLFACQGMMVQRSQGTRPKDVGPTRSTCNCLWAEPQMVLPPRPHSPRHSDPSGLSETPNTGGLAFREPMAKLENTSAMIRLGWLVRKNKQHTLPCIMIIIILVFFSFLFCLGGGGRSGTCSPLMLP